MDNFITNKHYWLLGHGIVLAIQSVVT